MTQKPEPASSPEPPWTRASARARFLSPQATQEPEPASSPERTWSSAAASDLCPQATQRPAPVSSPERTWTPTPALGVQASVLRPHRTPGQDRLAPEPG